MPEPAAAPPNPYSNMASMPGPMPPPKKDADVEELMKGFHGIFKALKKMEAMNPALAEKLTVAKKAMKDAVANVLKGDPSTLEDKDDSTSEPPPADASSNTATPPPDVATTGSNTAT